jgi:hypothetical protein
LHVRTQFLCRLGERFVYDFTRVDTRQLVAAHAPRDHLPQTGAEVPDECARRLVITRLDASEPFHNVGLFAFFGFLAF